MTDAVIKRNIFYSSTSECTFVDELQPGSSAKGEDRRGRQLARARDATMDSNIYFSAADRGLGEAFLKKQRAAGVDANSLAVDPLLVDPANGDFRLQTNSPALKLGIQPFDITKAGLRPDSSARPK